MSSGTLSRWHDGALVRSDLASEAGFPLIAADSWLVEDGSAFAIDLHRQRFVDAVAGEQPELGTRAAQFFDAVLGTFPREGAWFPRVELRSSDGGGQFFLRVRPAPERSRALTLSTHRGPDPRTRPTVKGPDIEELTRLRAAARSAGADDAVILSEDSHIIDGTTTAIAWWRGDDLHVPPASFARVDSVTARSLAGLCLALGIGVHEEAARPADLDGLEVWALNALHGIRIATNWLDGPSLAAEPGRLQHWRSRFRALRRPLEGSTA